MMVEETLVVVMMEVVVVIRRRSIGRPSGGLTTWIFTYIRS
jgi:hypothetical protein